MSPKFIKKRKREAAINRSIEMDVRVFSSINMEFEDVEYLIPCDDEDEFEGYVLPDDDDEDEFEGYVLPDDDERIEQAFEGYFLPGDDEVEFFEEGLNDYVLPELEDEFDFEEQPAASSSSSYSAADRLKNVVIEPMERCKTCSICLEELEVGGEAAAIECSHKFHRECILPWLATKTTCPSCRFQLL